MKKCAVPSQMRFRPAIEALEERRAFSVNSLSFLPHAVTPVISDLVSDTSAVMTAVNDSAAGVVAASEQLVSTTTAVLPPTLLNVGGDLPVAAVVDIVTTALPTALDAVLEVGTTLTTEVTTLAAKLTSLEVLSTVLDAPVAAVAEIVTVTLPDTLEAVLEIGTTLTTETTTLTAELSSVISLDVAGSVGVDAPIAVEIDVSWAPAGDATLLVPPDAVAVVEGFVPPAATLPMSTMPFSIASNTAGLLQSDNAQQVGAASSRELAAELDIDPALLAEVTDILLAAELNDATAEAVAENLAAGFGPNWITYELADLEETFDTALEAAILAGMGILGLGMLSQSLEDFLQELSELNRMLWNWLVQVGPLPWILMAVAALASVREIVRWRLQRQQSPRVSPLGLQIC